MRRESTEPEERACDLSKTAMVRRNGIKITIAVGDDVRKTDLADAMQDCLSGVGIHDISVALVNNAEEGR